MPTIRKRGTRYQAQVRLKENGVIVFSESASFDTEREARRWGSALEAQVTRDGAADYLARSTTLAQLAEKWLAQHERTKAPSRDIQHSYKAVVCAPFATRPLSNLKAQDLLAWGNALSATLAPSTVLHHFMVIRSMYSMGESLLGFSPDPTPLNAAMQTLKRTRILAKSRSRERRVSDDELVQLVLHFAGQATRIIPMGDFVQLAVALPRRREELLTMRWDDYTGGTLRLRDTKHPTTPRDEVIPVPVAAQAIIERQPRFDSEPRILPYKPESVSAAFQRAARDTALVNVRLHDLRHEGISRLFEAGLGIQEVALISGHVSWNALRRYTHIKPADVLEKLSAHRQRP